jgi:hypothetical protein
MFKHGVFKVEMKCVSGIMGELTPVLLLLTALLCLRLPDLQNNFIAFEMFKTSGI